MTQTALNAIMKSSNPDLEQIRTDYEEGVRTFVDDMYDDVVGFFKSSRFQATEANVSQLASNFASDVEDIFNRSEKLESDLGAMMKDLVPSSFQRLPTEKLAKKQERDVYRWDGDLDLLVRNFVHDLGSLGKDPERGTPSIYELVKDLVQDAAKLANQTVGEVTEGNYTIDTIEDALANTFKGISDGEDFDRDIVVRELSTMIDGVAKLYKLGDLDSEELIKSAINWVDDRLLDYSDGSIQRIPAKVFVAPLIFADYILGKVSNNIVLNATRHS